MLALALVAAPGCLLDPLKLGPGDEFSDDESTSVDAESDGSSSSESASDTSESESSSSESASDTSESDTSESESDTSESDTTGTSETDTGDGSCDPQGALPEGACETVLGYYWDGAGCLALEGCSCDDCPFLFESPVDCWLANQSCGPSPCAGVDEASCLADELCAARYAHPLALDIDVVCVGPESIYAGCGLATSCAAVVTYACPLLAPDEAHQFTSACLPELDWLPCDPPQPDPADCP